MTTTTGITTHGDVPSATYLQIDASGTILEQDGDMLVPTGGFVHIIPAEKVTQLDIDRRKELWTHSLTQHPTWLIMWRGGDTDTEGHERFVRTGWQSEGTSWNLWLTLTHG
jgi:hypothetical protein